MIDYVSLMLANMAAGLVIVALYILQPICSDENKGWSVAFIMSGLIAAITGFTMTFTWPLPSPYNTAFGEMSVLLGIILIGAGISIAKGWSLLPVCVYAIFAGLAAMLVGWRFIDLGLSQKPLLSGIGFILPGIGGVCAWMVVHFKKQLWLRIAGAAVLFAAAGIWLFTGCMAYWFHLLVK